MASPLKLAPSLVFGKISPISPKLLSPLHNYCYNFEKEISRKTKTNQLVPPSKNTFRSRLFETDCLNNNHLIKISVKEFEDTNEESYLINSPNKLNLLKYGIDECEVLHVLGKGSFGTVIKGKYKRNLVAAKIVKLELSRNIREVNALNFSHENIVKIIDIIVNQDEKYGLILMEYCRNSRNLQSLLDDSDYILEKNSIVQLAKQIVSGIEYCHKNNVLHLDIKPSNILLCGSVCKICDFGNSLKSSTVNADFIHNGTVAYTAPEIFMGNIPTRKSDVYSLGILFWQMIFRKSPYGLLDSQVVIYKVVKFNFRPDVQVVGISKEDYNLFLELCMRCWHAKPGNRPEVKEILTFLLFI